MKMQLILAGALITMTAYGAWCADQAPMHFNFENGTEGWTIPDWCMEQKECVVKNVSISNERFSNGNQSLKLACDFSGDSWSAAIIEYEKDLNLRGYKNISADIYVPKNASDETLVARVIVTAGSVYKWIEMRETVQLKGGEWVTIKAPLDMNISGELEYWQCSTHEACVIALLDKVKRVAIRIEHNVDAAHPKSNYKTDVYIDNVNIE